ncbi:MAG: hypothetical protein LAP86_20775 [Acidobacteriia bacterium]|nr:hypothetical protein [Terriglobia bacterium]
MPLDFAKPLQGFHDKKKSVRVHPVTGPGGFLAFVYTCMLNVDWDGAPDCYGLDRPGFPEQTGLTPWESSKRVGSLSNARRDSDWSKDWVGVYNVTKAEAIRILRHHGLIPPKSAKGADVLSKASEALLEKFWDNRTDEKIGSLENLRGDGKFPIVQISEMPTTMKRGYYVSTTGWFDRSKELWDPHCYLDASAIPYSVVPDLVGVSMGDYGLVVRNKTGARTPYVCGDSSGSKTGKSRKLGECSGAVYLAMGKENEGDFSFIVFPRSGSSTLNDPGAAERTVRTQLGLLSADDADDLANHLASDANDRFRVRTAMAQAGAPAIVIPAVDAVTSA